MYTILLKTFNTALRKITSNINRIMYYLTQFYSQNINEKIFINKKVTLTEKNNLMLRVKQIRLTRFLGTQH